MLQDPSRPPRLPFSTYRLQFNRHFTFRDAAEIVPYLHELGISDLYASPYLQARPGSLHGYDISDHSRLNADLGEPEDHEALTRKLHDLEMGHLLDIVPNHMGIGEPSNSWWMDMLENGPSSRFAGFFDVDWNPLKPELIGKVLLPILGDQFGRILENGELQLRFEDGRFRIVYYEQILPVSPRSSSLVLLTVVEKMKATAGGEDDGLIELQSIVTALENLPPRDRRDTASVAERRRESIVSRRRLQALHDDSPGLRTALDAALVEYNGTVGDPHSFGALERVLDDQAYRLAYWRVAAEEINYRRFFDINDLAGLRVERSEVFDATHRLILQLVAEGKVTGLRIDHPDGLFHPLDYLEKLQHEASRRAGGRVYLLVEKILTGDEPLPSEWPVAGTVGYDFLNRVNSLFVAHGNEEPMTEAYHSFIGHPIDLARLTYEKKKLILRVHLASELNVLAFLLDRISEKNRRFRDFTLGSLSEALRETIACFPVYRTYIDAVAGRVSQRDADYVNDAIRTALRRNRATSRSIFDFVRDVLLLRWPDDLEKEAREEHALFVMKFQQLTGPVMAKGVEDTSFYIYNRLVSLNEVGGEPDHFGIAPHDLHRWIAERAERWPQAMNSSSTHDTKRSEDVRARINVLSEIPHEWRDAVSRWAQMNRPLKSEVDGDPVPDANDEYLLYQTLVGAWPLDVHDKEVGAEFRDRVQAYMEKATREAKLHTSWINPNEVFDNGLREFIGEILDFGAGWHERRGFLSDFATFQADLAQDGMVNSLAQTLLKLTAPGVPDVYQGQEMWDFSLVDPDNRRPVDYDKRRAVLEAVSAAREAPERFADFASELVRDWPDGRIKMLVTHMSLDLRRERPQTFLNGDYVPLEVEGARADHLFAFARSYRAETVVVVVPRLPRTFRSSTGVEITDPAGWRDTWVAGATDVLGGTFRNVFTGASLRPTSGSERGSLPAGEVLGGFPVALLVEE
ncbi:MAG: malto-oligosyltrehalose synthase [Gemmatimonadota bacterium]